MAVCCYFVSKTSKTANLFKSTVKAWQNNNKLLQIYLIPFYTIIFILKDYKFNKKNCLWKNRCKLVFNKCITTSV